MVTHFLKWTYTVDIIMHVQVAHAAGGFMQRARAAPAGGIGGAR